MSRQNKPIRSDIAYSMPDKLVVRGFDLPKELIGVLNVGDFAWLQLTGSKPTTEQSRMFNAILVTLAEHGITPSALVARMTYLGAPEALQAAVAAGLCGLGSTFVGSTEGVARMLYEALPPGQPAGEDLRAKARAIVEGYRARREHLPGFGHPVHKPVDPRTTRLFHVAEECRFAGDYVRLIQRVAEEAEKSFGRPLTLNATGAIGAICCELGFKWQIVRGLGVMARAVGLVGHILEESVQPMAGEIWLRAEEEASAHLRNPGC